MQQRVLVFPAGLAEAKAFAEAVSSEGKMVIGASSVPNDEASKDFDKWIELPYIHDQKFVDALVVAIKTYNISAVFSSHATVRHRLSILLPKFAPGVCLLTPIPRQKTSTYLSALKLYNGIRASLLLDEMGQISNLEFRAVLGRALTIRGESSPDKLAAILALGSNLPCGDIVEIGALAGRSAFVLGWMARRHNIGSVLVIDAWTQIDAVQYDAPTILQDATRSIDFECLRAEFVENLIPYFHTSLNYCQARAHDIRTAYKQDFVVGSTEFGRSNYSGAIALLHVDGNHDYAAVRQDLEDWAPLVIPGGWIVVDDYVWSFGDGPKRAGDELLFQHSVGCAFVCDGALFLRLNN